MKKRSGGLAAWSGLVLLAICLLLPSSRDVAVAASGPCDRSCLEGFVDRYLDAMLAHDPGKVPLSPAVKFTENGQKLEPGDGLWRTITAKGTYQMIVADSASGHVAFLGSIREADVPAMLALHMKVRNDRIEQIETLVQRSDKSADGFDRI